MAISTIRQNDDLIHEIRIKLRQRVNDSIAVRGIRDDIEPELRPAELFAQRRTGTPKNIRDCNAIVCGGVSLLICNLDMLARQLLKIGIMQNQMPFNDSGYTKCGFGKRRLRQCWSRSDERKPEEHKRESESRQKPRALA